MIRNALLALMLLVSFSVALAQGTQTPRQVYESYLKANSNNEDVSQYFLRGVDTEALKKYNELTPEQKKEFQGMKNAFQSIFPKNERYIRETADGKQARLYYAESIDKEGYSEICMQQVQGLWKIDTISHHMNTKLPQNLPSQKAINTAFGAVKKQFPQVPVHGKINGIDFKPSHVKLWDKNTLTFAYPESICYDKGIKLWFHWYKNSLINTRMAQTVKPPFESKDGTISAWIEDKGKKTKMLEAGDFGIQLVLSPKNAKGLIPGYIVMQTTDPGTFIEGYFYATE